MNVFQGNDLVLFANIFEDSRNYILKDEGDSKDKFLSVISNNSKKMAIKTSNPL